LRHNQRRLHCIDCVKNNSIKMRSFVTGASGQAGSYLVEHLLTLGREVFAMVRRNTSFIPETSFLKDCLTNPKFHIVKGDLTDPWSLERLMEEIHPHEFYNAGAQSHVHESWAYPLATVDATAKGPLHCLEVIRKVVPACRFVQFSSSEIFGMAKECPQNENTPFYPRSPYGVSKLFGHWMTVNYRESYDLFACNAILFNMESPRRGPNFVTQKIAQGVAKIATQLELGEKPTPLALGNLTARRDWNDARRSVQTVVKILELEKPQDFVIGSGRTHSVAEFVDTAFRAADIEDWGDYVVTDPQFIRPAEVPLLCADPRKAVQILGYDPLAQKFEALVAEMVQAAMPKEDGLLRE
jgi:GDPmannose 4,6-dehydratase